MKPFGSTTVNFPIDDKNFEGTIQFSDGTCFSIYINKFDRNIGPEETEGFCTDWNEGESRSDYSNCERELARWYGCPRQIPGQNFSGVSGDDAFWAEREVNAGINGWEFDICCDNGTDPERRQKLHGTHYCKKNSCSYNYGADFCIRSPRHACRAVNLFPFLLANKIFELIGISSSKPAYKKTVEQI
ncbi:uncharacterized protein LOC142344317 [Convolutriloba macropyga]|uniref:uncharacterized protein LOC142344317 n=1 Tax=Convolutriloba macropyga TaxID=536237 RepID=UPI003F5229C6